MRKSTTLYKWAVKEKCSAGDIADLPVLVRLNKPDGWRQGNLAIIARHTVGLYERYGNLQAAVVAAHAGSEPILRIGIEDISKTIAIKEPEWVAEDELRRKRIEELEDA